MFFTELTGYSLAIVLDQAKPNPGAELVAEILELQDREIPDFEQLKKATELQPKLPGFAFDQSVKQEGESDDEHLQPEEPLPLENVPSNHEPEETVKQPDQTEKPDAEKTTEPETVNVDNNETAAKQQTVEQAAENPTMETAAADRDDPAVETAPAPAGNDQTTEKGPAENDQTMDAVDTAPPKTMEAVMEPAVAAVDTALPETMEAVVEDETMEPETAAEKDFPMEPAETALLEVETKKRKAEKRKAENTAKPEKKDKKGDKKDKKSRKQDKGEDKAKQRSMAEFL